MRPGQPLASVTETSVQIQGTAQSPARLRPHQVGLIAEIKAAIADGRRRIIGQAPTGFGKTIVGANLTREALDRGERVIFTVPALTLVDQTLEKFYAEGIREVGVIQADHHMTDFSKPVQIASVQTLMRRGVPAADLVIVDEVHRHFDFYETWMAGEHWANVPFVGLTATPWTRGLGKFYDTLIIGATPQELIDAGYLSRFRVFAPASPDLTGVHTVAGDYHEGELSKVMNKEPLVADVVDTWLQRARGRPTLCFAVDRVHAKHLQTKFHAAGIEAGYIDAYTERLEREAIKERFHRGEIKVVCNVGCLTTGIDWDVRCIILARPTKSEILFVQMVGRGLRTANGKANCLILDHSDTHLRLGFVTDIYREVLDDGKPRAKAEPKDQVRLPKKCPSCAFLKPPKVLACPACGFAPQPKCTTMHQDGELIELATRRAAVVAAQADKSQFYCELKAYAGNHNYKPGWIAHTFKQKFGHWPNGLDHLPPIGPSRTTLNWIKSRQIAWARGRAL